jgi:protein-S-isoprenylcysteine O-methyltransferase Ste14
MISTVPPGQKPFAQPLRVLHFLRALRAMPFSRFPMGDRRSSATLKVDHRLIQSGPYGWVRHPIYSGLLLALVGTVITIGTLQACVGVAIIFIAVVRKMALEEQWMAAQFGNEYEVYRRRVNALIPRR